MNFTPQERKMIERLRKQERQWRWGRWMSLVSGIFSAGICIAIFCMVVTRIQSKSADIASSALLLSLSFPIILIFTGHATICLLLAIRDWHGNTARTLLLRLLDECDKRSMTHDDTV
jgi:uncharacterized membrane protein HdeD (DUF308 family)